MRRMKEREWGAYFLYDDYSSDAHDKADMYMMEF